MSSTSDQEDARIRKTDETHYPMDHPRRGVATIINIERFNNSQYGQRLGSKLDVISLQTVFKKLGFDVEVHTDLTRCGVQRVLVELSNRDHSDCDCLAIVYMSHGLQGQLRASDELFNMNELFDPFTGERCPTMINKPKLFFIQACQGHERQRGVYTTSEVSEATEEPTGIDAAKMIIPSRADMLFAISTIPGYVSWRNPVRGSWYIQALCRWLDCEGFHLDMLTLLTKVTRQVAVECSVSNPFNPREPPGKQLPFFGSSLLRILHLTRKMRTCRSSKKKKSEDEKKTDVEDGLGEESLENRLDLRRVNDLENEFEDIENNENEESENERKELEEEQKLLRLKQRVINNREIIEDQYPLLNRLKDYFLDCQETGAPNKVVSMEDMEKHSDEEEYISSLKLGKRQIERDNSEENMRFKKTKKK